MAYYDKKGVLDFVENNIMLIESILKVNPTGAKALSTKEEVEYKIENHEDLVGFFWINTMPEKDDEGPKIKMEGKMFARVDTNIYTDDRFAIDLYESAVMGITVSDVIKKRNQEMEDAKKSFSKTEVEGKFLRKNDGA